MLTSNEIKQFQQLYYKNFGKKISQNEALDMGTKLVNLITVIGKNHIKINQEKYAAKNKR
ncbi:hypothetical protein K8R42_02605 [bacterium]|nr:hypothetical protein [bacterium]